MSAEEKMLSFKDRVKLEAKNESQKERLEEAKSKLLSLYKKLEQANKVVKNIKNEIADYEMELESE